MARLQDFASITPTSSDSVLGVQSAGQGLIGIDTTLSSSAAKIPTSAAVKNALPVLITDIFNTPGFTVDANTNGNTSVSVAKSGYTALGIIQLSGSGTNGISYSDWYIDGSDNARIFYRNNTSAAKTVNYLWIKVLYLKA